MYISMRDADSNENILPVANERFTSYLMANISDPFINICSYVIIISPTEFSDIYSSFFSCSLCPV